MGLSKLFINGELVIETEPSDDPLAALMGAGICLVQRHDFKANNQYKIRIESSIPSAAGFDMPLLVGMVGCKLGFMYQHAYEADTITEAVEAAKSADVALIFTGHTGEWESEGFDRETLNLPLSGSQDRLVEAVSKINPKTVVVNYTGAAVALPWIESVGAVIQGWFAGQEAGNSTVDILFGRVNPSGKLPISFPRTLEGTPSFGNFPGDLDSLQVNYAEGLEMGYRYYDKYPQKVLFPFGHGLSYTTFEISVALEGSSSINDPLDSLRVRIGIKNTGNVAGAEVVQAYLSPVAAIQGLPIKTLAAFTKVSVTPGDSVVTHVQVPIKAAAFWNVTSNMWEINKGPYQILVGNSSTEIVARLDVQVSQYLMFRP